jgi:hypothetical protein
LRWGVTEEDATLNKRVVQVCLERIDICRPFFLCFLGQRRGWVPQKEEIAGKTFEDFPGLYDYIDPDQTAESSDLPTSPSVTEMEIMHAVINPLHRGKSHADGLEIDKAKYAFFYLRDDHYLVGLPAAPVQIRHTYTNEGIGDPQKKTEADQALELWRNQIIPKTHRPINHYNAVWNTDAVTPELAYPITCPSTSKENILRWRARWAEVGVTISDHKLTIAKKETKKASAFNLSITKGRLTSFTCEGTPLSDIIFRDLTQAITERFPEHMHLPEDTPLQREMDQQDQFLQTASDGFIQRQGDFDRLNEYLEDQTKQTYALIG